ncbi:MAG: M56 family metallopeptidase [Prevotella sp.]|nr:M56 family metallopeptidase [Prevotella sp.]
MIDYQVKAGLCLVVFYLLFKLLMSRDTLHRFNRVLLLTLAVLSMLMPWLPLPTATSGTAGAIDIGPLTVVPYVALSTQQTTPSHLPLLHLIYYIGAAMVLLWQLWSAWRLHRLTAAEVSRTSEAGGIRVHVLRGDVAPLSYFRHIVVSEADMRSNPREILTHERAHIRLGHSLDLVLMNLLIVVQWWNPASWLLRRELQQIHEYEADEAVLKAGVDARQYQLLLIRKSVGNQLFSMANNLNHNSLKQRIRMMKKQKQSPWLSLKVLAMVPVAAVLAVACGQKSDKADEPLTVGVEAPSEGGSPEVAVVGSESAEGGKVFDVVEQMPEYPGGMAELMKYLTQNLIYPKEAEAAKEEGRVIVTFVVDTDGTVSDARVVKSVSPLLDAEALRVVQGMPSWTPGMQDGEAVRVKYSIPVTFKLQ